MINNKSKAVERHQPISIKPAKKEVKKTDDDAEEDSNIEKLRETKSETIKLILDEINMKYVNASQRV